MLSEVKEHKFPYLERGRLISMLTRAGFVSKKNSHGWHIYVAHPKEGDAKIENHYLPVAFLTVNSYIALNLDESSLKGYHDKLKEIYASVLS